MGLDLDPYYYTETMVRILRDQGHSQHAMELAELILEKNGENAAVRTLLGEMKTEARRVFERFKNSGRNVSGDATVTPESAVDESETAEKSGTDLTFEAVETESSAPDSQTEPGGEIEADTEAAAESAALSAAIVEMREPVRLTLVSDRRVPNSRARLLQTLLERIQRRRSHEIRQA